MANRVIVLALVACGLALISGCHRPPSGKLIRSVKSGEVTVRLSSETGVIRVGPNDFFLTFTDNSGHTVDVGNVSLVLHMASMEGMDEMNDTATLVTTGTLGQYKGHVNVEAAGDWEVQVNYQGTHGKGKASIPLTAE
ncbi:MAG TPA: FixH family protein [Blastocatellia bacterium]|nr:FixH family protein [Blastocatellia bacterium]